MFKFDSITVLHTTSGTDQVLLNTEQHSTPFPNMGYPCHAVLHCQRGYGLEWVIDHEFAYNYPIYYIDAVTGHRFTIEVGCDDEKLWKLLEDYGVAKWSRLTEKFE